VQITVSVNGSEHTHDVEPRLLLVDFIRTRAALTGTHIGCDTTSCGACTVLLDGTPVKSCTVLAVQADGRAVMTVEASTVTLVDRRSRRRSRSITGCSAGSAPRR